VKKLVVNCETGETVEVDFTPEEIDALEPAENGAWVFLREERNRLLAACDWTVATDSPVDVVSWTTYRQALRDLPANTIDPFSPVWPTSPA